MLKGGSIQTEIPSVKDGGISIKPESSPFKAVEVNGNNVINGEGAWPRDVDTEYKILSDIQSKLGDNYSASGKIKLYTELVPCPSCQSVIEQFKNRLEIIISKAKMLNLQEYGLTEVEITVFNEEIEEVEALILAV